MRTAISASAISCRRIGWRVTEWIVTEEERDRLLRELPRLPGGGRDGTTVVLDFGRRCLRGEGSPATILPLPASEVTGRPLRLTCDWRYLLAALKLGFRTVAATAVEQPLVWWDDTRTYLFLPVAEAPQTGRRSSSPKDAAVQPPKIKKGPAKRSRANRSRGRPYRSPHAREPAEGHRARKRRPERVLVPAPPLLSTLIDPNRMSAGRVAEADTPSFFL